MVKIRVMDDNADTLEVLEGDMGKTVEMLFKKYPNGLLTREKGDFVYITEYSAIE